ncbi:cytochrome P450 [Novosphingobium sp.]|uniref:cytochrome P450 n=1 Tax=Novosphingobium sp. TaxID=1874826 RepID=UPI0022CACFE9|nr:cytochrome P450 [Novosphingobium sp.]MCZ8019374.1 cytochrome P450 [Novosphingobium sp.]MCZ8035189.1 cytochrome P450 [Novosphingobium sp.]MCZ8050503.1 cytochrome P450 [Novosphingobium sp.]MCZ8058849.1 cytochrome P450 [Novosphingobium sp.]MCZ8232294.1 cytochrome P450 [Novosphingobium sp.]
MTIAEDLARTIIDPKSYAKRELADAAFARLRAEAPLDQAVLEEFDPFWVVTRHADIKEIERQPNIFHNGDKSTFLSPRDGQERVKMLTGGEPNLIRSLVSVDGDEHKALRSVVFPHVTPRAIKPLEDQIRAIAREFVDHMLAFDGQCDFAADVAFLYPLRVIMTVLGVPQEDEPFMLKLTQELFNNADPELNRRRAELSPDEMLKSLWETTMELENYFAEVTKKFRAQPTGAINSLIANAKIGDEYLNHRQLMGYYIIAATAGHDTTSNTTAGAMWALAERPELLKAMQDSPDRINAFVEESIRWEVPVKHFMRSAVEDCEIDGRQIRAGDWLMLSYQSANRDETVWADPFEFRIDREQNPQIAFGYGVHVCLGQHLARMEMRILWEELFKRLKSVEMNGAGERTISNFVCGPKHVPIRFTVN